MEFKGRVTGLNTNYFTEKISVVIECEDVKPVDIEKLKDKDLRCTLKQWREKRSLDANAYCWALINEIANITRLEKDEVYLQMLKDYGQNEVVSIQSHINPDGYFKYYEELGKGYVGDKEFTHYRLFKGSSEYDSREMSILIDGVIHEAEALGIPTITEKQLAQLKGEWRNE